MRKVGRPKGTKQKYVDREKMWELYLQGKTSKEIAEELGHHIATIRNLIADRISLEQVKGAIKK